MIFPGMDPWLEDPAVWPGVHNGIVYCVVQSLNRVIRPKYTARLDARLYIQGPPQRDFIPDVAVQSVGRKRKPKSSGATATLAPVVPVRVSVPGWEVNESVVRIHDRDNNLKLVAWIEVVSHSSKYLGEGRKQYLAKQHEILNSEAHWVEIDLLRAGPHVLAVPESLIRDRFDYEYMVSVNRAGVGRTEFEIYPITLRQSLPVVRIPLANGDHDATLDLQAALEQTYTDGAYSDWIDYSKPCVPGLSSKDQRWANNLLRAAGRK